ncbi:MAG TPA: hypothetical protein VL069_01595, partial [Opitutus sp.]|nr:hypothetical protein [Opitutus sp.]
MLRPRSAQEFIHWLEMGGGARLVATTTALLGLLVLSLFVAWKQFQGVTAESALLQADVGRQLARGEGFSTLVNLPQTAAFLQQRGHAFDASQPYPELHHAPLYSVVIAGGLRLLPASFRESLFDEAPVAPDGFGGDYFLLGLNLGLLWLTAWLTFALARRLFDAQVGWLAAFAVLLSVGIWQQTVIVNGAPLLMLLGVTAFWIWLRIDEQAEATSRLAMAWLVALGASCGLLFLTEYSAGALILVALGYAAFRFKAHGRWRALILLMAGFAVVTAPWTIRNINVAGNPVALAVQNVALKFGDPTAEPSTYRRTLSAELPSIDLKKLANKTLTGVQQSLQERLWSGGAMWFAGFLAAGWLYTFRSSSANRLRWVFTVALGVMILSQALFNSGESERFVTGWMAPLIIVFGAGFFSVLLGSNAVLSQWPRWCMAGLLVVQALPLAHDALEPRRLHFHYPPYFPALFIGVHRELQGRDTVGRFGVMADVPAGVAWYGQQRVWAQPQRLRDFYAITLEQPIGGLLLTPHTLDRPFFSELAARPVEPAAFGHATDRFGEWGRIYAGLFTGRMPADFPLNAPQKLAENLYVLMNPAL